MLLRSQKIVVVFGAWEIVSLMLLTLINSMLYEYLFILDLIGLLVIVQLMSPYVMKPRWRSNLNVFLMAGVAIFCLLVIKKAEYDFGLKYI